MSKQLVALLFLLVGTIPLPAQKVLAGNSTIPTAEPFPSPAIHALQIASGDLLDLEVFDTPELSAKLRVDEHGAIALPVAPRKPGRRSKLVFVIPMFSKILMSP
jgi:hypothetical protein